MPANQVCVCDCGVGGGVRLLWALQTIMQVVNDTLCRSIRWAGGD